MLSFLKIFTVFTATVLFQVTLLPAYIADPFKPNLFIIAVTYLGLKGGGKGGFIAFGLGLLQDCFSGIYLGLNGFSYLCQFLVLNLAADRLYTESRFLMVFVVFLATIANGLINLLLLLIFSTAEGIYATLLADLLPQAITNALISSILFNLTGLTRLEESR
jgi:rod shape-determining protein MreD